METATNDAATVAPAKALLIKDYELKVRYLTDHFGRMWTRFNRFRRHRVRARSLKLIFANGTLSAGVCIPRRQALPDEVTPQFNPFELIHPVLRLKAKLFVVKLL